MCLYIVSEITLKLQKLINNYQLLAAHSQPNRTSQAILMKRSENYRFRALLLIL